jgi:AcrR family transcriptional regulator
MTDVVEPTRVPVGRPRDPDVDRKVLAAAAGLFGDQGWAGASIDAIARASGVSKRSIYLRWSNKDHLLSEALTKHLSVVSDIATGALRTDLIELARQIVVLYSGDSGSAALRLAFEASGDTAALREELRQSQLRAARSLVRRAIENGDLPKQTSPVLLLDAICGAALNHVISSPPHRRGELGRNASRYATALVDFVCGGLSPATP